MSRKKAKRQDKQIKERQLDRQTDIDRHNHRGLHYNVIR